MSISTSYSWHVCQLFSQDTPNEHTVFRIDAYLYGIDSKGINNTVRFSTSIPVPDSYSPGEFTDYDNLTKDQVIGWITSTLTTEEQQAIKDKLTQRLLSFYDDEGNVGIGSEYFKPMKPPIPWDES
tara:strand:- start:168 stop:545 length:378 start_codon:yes stop_codon:yes gene_type:complete